MGFWYCSEKYIVSEPQQCAATDDCCGTRSISDPDNLMVDITTGACLAPEWPNPSAYTPTYADAFGRLLDTWLYLNDVVPTATDPPDGSCALHWDEYTCLDEPGCMWEHAPHICNDIPGYPDFPAKPNVVKSPGSEYNPQFGDTGNAAGYGDPDHNLHGYFSEIGETIEFVTTAGTCVRNDCCLEECENAQHGTVDQYFELWNEDMTETIELFEHGQTYTFETAGQHYFKVFVRTKREGKPVTHDWDLDALAADEICDNLEDFQDWSTTDNCWDSDFGGPYTFVIIDPEGDLCEPLDECPEYIDPGTLNGMCVDYDPPSPGCPEQFAEDNPGVTQPQNDMDPACWRGKCLQEFLMDDDYTVCTDMVTFQWCVHWNCGNGYSEYLEDTQVYLDMESCLCNPDSTEWYRPGDCTNFDNFINTGQFETVEFGGADVYRPMGETVETGGSGEWFECGEETGYSDGCQYLSTMLGWEGEISCTWVGENPITTCQEDTWPLTDTSCVTAYDCASLMVDGGCDYQCVNPNTVGAGQCMWVDGCPGYNDDNGGGNDDNGGGNDDIGGGNDDNGGGNDDIGGGNDDNGGGNDDNGGNEPCEERECCTDADALVSCDIYGDVCIDGWCEWSSESAQDACQSSGDGCSGTGAEEDDEGGITEPEDHEEEQDVEMVVIVTVPAEMTIEIEEVPAAGSSAMKVLAGGLKKAIEGGLYEANSEASVRLLTVGGTPIDDDEETEEDGVVEEATDGSERKLAAIDVEFEVLLPIVIAEGEEVPTAEEAGGMADAAFQALNEAVTDDDFTTELAESMQEAAAELVESGEVEESDVAAIVASVEVEVITVVAEEPEVGEIEFVVVEDFPSSAPTDSPSTSFPTDSPTGAPTDAILLFNGSQPGAKLAVAALASAIAVTILMV